MKFTNNHGIALPIAVWLAHDEYDYVNEENYISATRLMKPLRHIVLPPRMAPADRENPDISDRIATAFGHSLHDSIEKAWLKGYRENLTKLGYPEKIINLVRINPDPLTLRADDIPVYMEQRVIKSFMGYRIGGKYDLVAEGQVQDYKSTSAFVWVAGSRDDEHILQGSLYRWLNPDIITKDTMVINYIFTDWAKSKARQDPRYPQLRVMSKELKLLTIEETERWVKNKLLLIQKHWNTPEDQLPECTDEELWRSDPQFKYYLDPTKTARSTKNFENMADAKQFMNVEKGGKGIIKIIPGEVKRCDYCDSFNVCTQKDKYFDQS